MRSAFLLGLFLIVAMTAATAENKIDPALLRFIDHLNQDGIVSPGSAPLSQYSTQRVHINDAGAMQVVLRYTSLCEEGLSALLAVGFVVERSLPEQHIIQGWVPFHRLHALAALEFVQAIQAPNYARRR